MPIVWVTGKLVHFAHVPRCGGSAVENYLRARFGALGLLDRSFLKIPENERWSRSSPQHIETVALDRLLPPASFAARFALVRHPVDRLASVFRFQRDLHRLLPTDLPFADWLRDLPDQRERSPHYLDNHPRPMTEMVPAEATVFKLEDGMAPLLDWLDDLAGDERGPRQIAPANVYVQRLEATGREQGPDVEISGADRERIAALYADDFERFGYTSASAPAD